MLGFGKMANRRRPRVYAEGPDAAWRMEFALGQVLSVSKDELRQREEADADARSQKPKRGPKPGQKRAAARSRNV